MKKILAVTLFSALALSAGAQNWLDALTYAETDYLGTARSVGMGGAMTAVGGDLGSLTFNPAGSAVAGYSQFTITPGLTISSVVGQGTLLDGQPYGFEDRLMTPKGGMHLPNVGAVMVFDTRNTRGLKRFSFGIVGNATRDYTYKLRGRGTNDNTTLAASLATQADGYSTSLLSGGFDQWDIPSWEAMVGYKSGIFDPVPGTDNAYMGLTERLLDNGDLQLASPISQYYCLDRSGSKYDLLMNFAMDFSDRFYLGANIGVTSLSIRNDETRAENALGGGDYPSGFQSLEVASTNKSSGSGIYAKVGFIARPFAGLRIGAAIQTPTLLEINSTYYVDGRSVADGVEWSQSSPEDNWSYLLRTPLRVNAGVAYTFGKTALVSADYEYCDYQGMRFRSPYNDPNSVDYSDVNLDISDLTGPVHAIRLGGELKPSSQLALRVGYNLTTSAQYNVLLDNGTVSALSFEERRAMDRSAVSFGVGYNSTGSFFADFAVRFQFLPDEYYTPYYYYFRADDGTLYQDADIITPEIWAQARQCNALLTLGWRF